MPTVVESYKKLIQTGDLPPLSQVGLEISRLGERDDLSAAKLAALISKDPALAAKVLRIANSPFYGLRTQVKTLDHAIVVLGQVSIVSICAAFTMLSALKMPKLLDHKRYAPNALRSHSVLAAILARWLAQQFASPQMPAADSFLGGLLHDIGELATAVYYAKHLGHIHQYEQEHPESSNCQAEQAILGFDHQELGGEVLNYWHLPQQYIDMAQHHHTATDAVNPIKDKMVALVQTADQLAVLLHDGLNDIASCVNLITKIKTLPIRDMSSEIIDKLDRDIERILNEARVMIEQSGV